MNFYDSHTHLSEKKLRDNREQHLLDFIEIGGNGFVNIGTLHRYNKIKIQMGRDIQQKLEELGNNTFLNKISLGIHPLYISDGTLVEQDFENSIQTLRQQYLDNQDLVVYIGECGIDTYRHPDDPKLDLQKKIFRIQLELARELKLPVCVHSRNDFQTTFDVLKDYLDLQVYIHCWSYDEREIKLMQDTFPNLRIGFCGNISYKNAENLRRSLKAMKLDQLLLETDAPYLPAQVIRGEMNTPSGVKYIYEFVSEFLDIQIEDLCERVEENFKMITNPPFTAPRRTAVVKGG